MKKRALRILASASLIAAMVFSLVGCGTSSFVNFETEDNVTNITAQKSSESTGVCYIEVNEGEKIVVAPSFAGKGSMTIEIFEADAFPDSETPINDLINGEATPFMTEKIEGVAPYKYAVEPGAYVIRVTVAKGTDGTATIKAEADE